MSDPVLPSGSSSGSIRAVARLVRVLRSIAPQRAREVFLVPPATAGSLGDQAILQGILEALLPRRARLARQVLPASFRPQSTRGLVDAGTMRLVLHSRRWVARFLFELSRCRCLVILGADVIDGRYDLEQALLYLHACRLAAEAGVPARVASFSFSDKPAPEVVNSLARMPQAVRFFVRDPVSLERFRSATGQEATLAADAAFLMAPTAESETAREAIGVCREWRTKGHTLIGVNINPLTLPGPVGEGIDAYAAELSAFLRERPEIRLLLVPHDTRPLHSDVEALSSLLARLDVTGGRAAMVRPPLDAWDARAVVREVDVVVTGRMHLAISALSQAVPAIGVAYMGKFEGLMQHFSLRSSLVSPQEILRAGVLRRMVDEVLARRAEHVATIERALPAVIELARRNVEGLA